MTTNFYNITKVHFRILFILLTCFQGLAQESTKKSDFYLNFGTGYMYDNLGSSRYFADANLELHSLTGEFQINHQHNGWGFRYGAEINLFNYNYDFREIITPGYGPDYIDTFGYYTNKVYNISLPILANYKKGKWQTSFGASFHLANTGFYDVRTANTYGTSEPIYSINFQGARLDFPVIENFKSFDWLRFRAGIMYQFNNRISIQANGIIFPKTINEFYLKLGYQLNTSPNSDTTQMKKKIDFNQYVNLGTAYMYDNLGYTKYYEYGVDTYFLKELTYMQGYNLEYQVNYNIKPIGIRTGLEFNYFKQNYDVTTINYYPYFNKTLKTEKKGDITVLGLSIPVLINYKRGKWQTSFGINYEFLHYGNYHVSTAYEDPDYGMEPGFSTHGLELHIIPNSGTSFRLRLGGMYDISDRINVQMNAVYLPNKVHELFIKFGYRLK